jgi:hypothetical protein
MALDIFPVLILDKHEQQWLISRMCGAVPIHPTAGFAVGLFLVVSAFKSNWTAPTGQ